MMSKEFKKKLLALNSEIDELDFQRQKIIANNPRELCDTYFFDIYQYKTNGAKFYYHIKAWDGHRNFYVEYLSLDEDGHLYRFDTWSSINAVNIDNDLEEITEMDYRNALEKALLEHISKTN